MNIQIQFSCSLLSQQTLLTPLLHQLSNLSQEIVIRQTNCQCEHDRVYQKLRLICTGNPSKSSLFSLKIWQLSDILSPAQLQATRFHIVYNPDYASVPVSLATKTVISISEFAQIGPLLSNSVFELQKRCKIQSMMRSAHLKYQQNIANKTLKDIAERYWLKTCQKGRKILVKRLLTFNEMQLNLMKKYYTIWRIAVLEKGLNDMHQQIVEQHYFSDKSEKLLLRKTFKAWLRLMGDK